MHGFRFSRQQTVPIISMIYALFSANKFACWTFCFLEGFCCRRVDESLSPYCSTKSQNFTKVGNELAPRYINVCRITWLCKAVFSLVFNKSLSNLVILVILGVHSAVLTNFLLTGPSWKMKKSWKESMAAKNVFDGLNISKGFNWNQATTLVWQEPILDSRARVLTELRYISFQNRVSVDKVSVVVWLPVHFIKRFALSSETTPAAIIIKVKWISTSLAFDHYKKPNQSSFSWQQSYKKRGTVFQNDQNWNRQKGSFCT